MMIPTTFTSDHDRGVFSREGACERSPNSNINIKKNLRILVSTCLAEHASDKRCIIHHVKGFSSYSAADQRPLTWKDDSVISAKIFTTKWDPSEPDEVSKSPTIYGNIPQSPDLFRKQKHSRKGRVIKMYIVFRIREHLFQEIARKNRNIFFNFNLSTGYMFMYSTCKGTVEISFTHCTISMMD